jgi:hypothetical protein
VLIVWPASSQGERFKDSAVTSCAFDLSDILVEEAFWFFLVARVVVAAASPKSPVPESSTMNLQFPLLGQSNLFAMSSMHCTVAYNVR